MSSRQNEIASGLEAAERAKKELQLADQRAGDIVREAKVTSADNVAQAEKRSQQIIEEAKVQARFEAEKVIASAKAEIEQETDRMRESLRSRVVDLAVAGAERILRREVDAKAHSVMLAEIQKDL